MRCTVDWGQGDVNLTSGQMRQSDPLVWVGSTGGGGEGRGTPFWEREMSARVWELYRVPCLIPVRRFNGYRVIVCEMDSRLRQQSERWSQELCGGLIAPLSQRSVTDTPRAKCAIRTATGA